MAAVFGYAEQSLERQREFRACDPLVSTSWFNETRLMLWAGDASGAEAIARQGDNVAPGSWLTHALIRALTANGAFDVANMEISNRLQLNDEALVLSIMVAAARNDHEQASALLEEFHLLPHENGFWEFLVRAWTGDRESMNRMAAQVDQHPVGPLALTLLTYWCACGAPFDLEFSPNFAARIEEAGLPWPPVSPIEFPLKDW